MATAQPPPRIPDHELLRPIGEGGYGEVWLARNVMGTLRAVKVVRRERFKVNETRPYEREYEGIRKYEPVSRTHDGLVDVLQIGRNDAETYFYYVMELADDANSEHRTADEGSSPSPALFVNQSLVSPEAAYCPKTLEAEARSRGRLPVQECVKIGLAMSEALGHLHANGLVHRDVKPSNIIFVHGIPKLADIGLVTEAGNRQTMVGTKGFYTSDSQGTPQGDLYSLGKVLYEISTGQDRELFPQPISNQAPADERAQWAELNEIILSACDTSRYATAAEMRDELALLRSGRSIRRIRLLERRVKMATVLAGLLALLVLLGAGAFWVQSLRRTASEQRAKAAGAQEEAHRRQIMEKMLQSRFNPHEAGWSSWLWQTAAVAALIHRDSELQAHAAASLMGLDAHLSLLTNGQGSSIAFDRTGQNLMVGGYTGGRGTNGGRLLHFANGQWENFAESRPGPVGFRPDGTPVQFAAKDATDFALTDLVKNQSLIEFKLDGGLVSAPTDLSIEPILAMTPDAKFVAAGAAAIGARFAVWDTVSGKLLFERSNAVTSMAFGPDGSVLATADEQGRIQIWSLPDGREVRTLEGNGVAVLSLAFAPAVEREAAPPKNPTWRLAAGDAAGNVSVFDSKRPTATIGRGSYNQVYVVAFSPDGMTLASGGRGQLRVWEAVTGKLLLIIPGNDYVTGLSFSPDGKRLAACSRTAHYDGRIAVWELENGRGIRTFRGLEGQVEMVEFSSDGKMLAAVSQGQHIGIWDLAEDRLRHVLHVPRMEYAEHVRMAFDRSAGLFAFTSSAEAGGEAQLWNVATGQLVEKWLLPPSLGEMVKFTDSGQLLSVRYETLGGKVPPYSEYPPTTHPRVWRVRELPVGGPPRLLHEITNFNWHAYNIVSTPDGARIAIDGRHGRTKAEYRWVKGFETVSGTEVWSFPFVTDQSLRLNIDTAGETVWFGTNSTHSLRVNLRTGDVLSIADGGTPIAISGDGTRWAVGGGYLMASGRKEPQVMLGMDSKLSQYAEFDPKGRYLAWGSDDGTVGVYDLEEIRRRLSELGLGW